jgi:hypothetical protein
MGAGEGGFAAPFAFLMEALVLSHAFFLSRDALAESIEVRDIRLAGC